MNGFLKFLIKNQLCYKFLKPILAIINRREKEPYRIWLRFILDILVYAYGKKKNTVIWMNSMTPTEIAYSLGAVPILPEVIASIVSYLGLSRRYLSISEKEMSTDICSFHRCILGLSKEGILPEPKVILTSSNICDGSNKFYHYLSSIYKCPHLFIDVPYSEDEYSLRYLSSQVENILKDLSEILSISIDKNKVYQTIYNSNRARFLIEEINKMRTRRPSPFPGNEGLSYLVGMNFWSHGSPLAIDFYLSLRRFIEANQPKDERLRILWLHQIRPYYKNDIFEILESHGVSISFEEANYIYWPEMEVEDPIKAIAKKIISNIWQGPIERRINAIVKMIEDYSIDGVIHFSPWGCRQGCGGSSIIGDFLGERGVPFLLLPGDGVDPDNYSPGQTKTRIEAFLETMGL